MRKNKKFPIFPRPELGTKANFQFPISVNSGFTLIEVLISLFIIVVMTTVFLANYKGGERSNNLFLAQQQLISDLRTSQNKGLGSTSYNGSFPAGGWGVHLSTASPNNYIIFADVNGNDAYEAGEADPIKGGQTVLLPPGIIINSLLTVDGVSSPASLDITSLPPDPVTRIYNGAATSSIGYITLKNTVTSRTSIIMVNALGLIQGN
jgi:prepilin-type N-terminal cleavage/methylation domain-containing protein